MYIPVVLKFTACKLSSYSFIKESDIIITGSPLFSLNIDIGVLSVFKMIGILTLPGFSSFSFKYSNSNSSPLLIFKTLY